MGAQPLGQLRGEDVAKPKKIVIISTLDTKGEETQFVKTLVEGRGHFPIIIDCGIRGAPYFQPSVSRQAVAEVPRRPWTKSSPKQTRMMRSAP